MQFSTLITLTPPYSCPSQAGRRGGALDEAADEEERMQHMTMQREEQIKLHSKVRAGEHRKTVVSKPIDINATYEPPSYPKSDAEIKCIDEALGENFIFSELTHEQRLKLIDAMQKEQVAEGTAIITQGDEKSDFFYVVEEGTVNFIANGNHVGSCSKGGSFGELALLYNSPRAASCLAETKCKLWKVDQYTFRYMLARNAHEQEQDLCKVINKIDLFSTLDMKCKLKFAESMTRVKFACGERIVTKGDPGEVFYIIENGNVKISDIGLGDSQAVDQILTAGDWFGERSLLTGEPRAATVTAVSDVTCLAVARNTFESTIGSLSSALDHGMKKHFLKSLPLFAHSAFNDHEIDQLADLVTEQCFRKGDKLAEMDKPYRRDLWIIRHGRLLVVGKKGKTYKLKTGDYFGDKSVKAEKGRLSSHDAIVEENTTCWVLSREDMESVIGDINRLGDIVPFAPSTLNKTITLNRLKKHRILGMGAFGKVWLVSHKTTKAPYALKVIDKKVVVRAQQAKSVIREKNIMASLEHPLLISLVASFQDDFNLYLVLGLIQGGELFSILHKDGRKNLPVSDSRFYAACVVEALNHLHQRNIAYRCVLILISKVCRKMHPNLC
jgi:cAMP-dependent protein kinase regulator